MTEKSELNYYSIKFKPLIALLLEASNNAVNLTYHQQYAYLENKKIFHSFTQIFSKEFVYIVTFHCYNCYNFVYKLIILLL